MSTPTLCLCGCGQPVQLEGRPARFRPGHNMKTPEGRAAMAARSRRLRACGKLGISSRPGGGRKIDREGYLLVKASGHPQADCQGLRPRAPLGDGEAHRTPAGQWGSRPREAA
jgi:hypothetical protein